MGHPRFTSEVLDGWRHEREVVEVETAAGPDAPEHRTIIWIVVDEAGRALIRSYRGRTARWYREALATGAGAILRGDERTEVSFERADDPARIAACSAELARKYAGDPATPKMVAHEVLDTTLELMPSG